MPRVALATGLTITAMTAFYAEAQAQQAEESQPVELPAISVEGTTESDGYKADHSANHKLTAPLLDTPRTVTIINQQMMEDRGFTSLTDVLRTTPGITLGSGEGGTPVGDRPFIRGFEASTDMMVDGMRNLGRINYEVFNLEQVEINKGPGSAYAGRGSTGGTINMVSKTPQAENFAHGSATIGTDATKRVTVDGNYMVNENVAIRLNAMWHDAEVAGRDHVDFTKMGFAPSITVGLNSPTRATLSYYHLQTDEMPDFGHPFDPRTGKPADVSRKTFYGFVNRDFRETQTDLATLTVEHDLNDAVTLRNATRYSWMNNDYALTRPSQTAAQAAAGEVARAFRSSNRDTTSLLNQTDVLAKFETGTIKHDLVFGFEISREEGRNRGYSSANQPTVISPIHNPDVHLPTNPLLTATGESRPVVNHNKAIYLFDTITLTDQWMVNGGLRWDDYKVESGDVSSSSSFLNYQAGIVYKPVSNASIYFNYGTSSNPSGETEGMSGGADGPAGGNLGGNRAELDPERSHSFEIGTKWDLLNERLSLTAAVFRTEKTNQRATDPATGEVALIGNTRVDGVELGIAGKITEAWSVWGGYTYLDAVLRDDGAGTNEGNLLKFIAPHSFSLWTTYDVTSAFTLGGGAFYTDRRYVNDANTMKFDPYWRFDAMASYRVNDRLDLQLNVLNLLDETIYDASHVGAFALVAPGRSALLTANVRF
ncbi:TonB-dependent siderophore receptor [Telmatospirillum sp. J64-1]|uniref:TonB-dependent receptor n=1 Tax=Telmatospirillum sp. J64-1 TaxID=2502183 RepID=UPI001C8F5F32|nr:TonB-dependent siderophore receptor [Telmatospirillum sp. J64-1]